MANKKRPGASDAPSGRASKRRKAAEVSEAKTKEIVDEEESFEQAEVEEIAKTEQRKTDLAQLNEQSEEPGAVVGPGAKLWNTSSKLSSGGDLSDVAKYNEFTRKYVHTVNVEFKYPFMLKPIVLTDGSHKGARVLLLEPVEVEPVEVFRFLDLPSEIRNMIYSELFTETEPILISSITVVYVGKRPVRSGFEHGVKHKGLEWDRKNKKWLGQPPSAFALLRTCKQILKEAASVAYGDNSFSFDFSDGLKLFLQATGSMRQYLREIHVSDLTFSRCNKNMFCRQLKDAKNLQTITLDMDLLCDEQTGYWFAYTPEIMANILFPLVKDLHEYRIGSDLATNALDIIKVDGEKCQFCRTGKSIRGEQGCGGVLQNTSEGRKRVKCTEIPAISLNLQEGIRSALAQRLKIKEEV